MGCLNVSVVGEGQKNIVISSRYKYQNKREDLNIIEFKDIFVDMKSQTVLQRVFNNLSKSKKLKMVKYNKSLKGRLNLNNRDYKEYGEVKIEIKPVKNEFGKFINIKKGEESYYHIYFNDDKEEIKRNYFNENDNVTNINIIIDYQVKSFRELFNWCKCIESISFKRFYLNNINNMDSMFGDCSSLKEINLSHFNTNNVTNMYRMFWGCSSLKEINLSNFNTDKVTNMKYMFYGCSEELKTKIKAQFKNIREEAFY